MSLLEMDGIVKSFNGVTVLDKVRLHVDEGEVHALLGENGAGKSTLMNVLTGVVRKDSGKIVFDGREIAETGVKFTERLGIAFVHQELNLFNDLKVYENIFLGREYTGRFGCLDKKRMITESAGLFERLGVDIDPTMRVSELKTSEKQLLEISKALFFDAKLLILDEPTTSLNTPEVAHLFSIIRSLRKKGTSFIFISHKMPEIFAIADRYTVLRNGEYVASGDIADTDPETVTGLMVGRAYSSEDVYREREHEETVLLLDHYSGDGFSDISLTVKKGQIIGFTGLQGSGSSELMKCMFGLSSPDGGYLEVRGKRLKGGSPQEAMKAGIGLLASDRKENSVLPDMDLLENMYISEQVLSARKWHINLKKEKRIYAGYADRLSIKAEGPESSILSLSGGNQQKIFIARWLDTDADILLLDNPTQGIDVGAKAEIYRLILKMSESGKTILINTLEIPEIRRVADCCAVFYEGGIVKILKHDEIEEAAVMLYATGAAGA